MILPVSYSQAEVRTFTNQDGQTIKAEIVSATDRLVKIRREDGAVFEVPHTTFSLDDRKYIEEWIKKQKVEAAPLRLRVNVSQTKKTVNRSQGLSSTSRVIEAGYRIQIKNESTVALEKHTIEYRIFKFAERADRNNRPGLNKVAGKINNISIPRFSQDDYKTEVVTLVISQLKPDWYYVDGSNSRTADSLAGIWLRLMNPAGDVVHEYLSSEKLAEEGW